MEDRRARASWEKRWSAGQTNFHEEAPNALLTAHATVLESPSRRSRILVPLAGRTFDLRWLAERGHEVVGVEFVESAVTSFFEHWEKKPTRSTIGGHPAYAAGGVTLVVADMLDVTVEALGTFDAIFDRAALVALDPGLRGEYVALCRSLLRPDGVTLLVALGYDASKVSGPPFSVDDAEVAALFAPRVIERIFTQKAATTPRMRAAGVPSFEESVYRILENRQQRVPETGPRGPNEQKG